MAHPLPEVVLRAVCGTMAACDDDDVIRAAEAARGHRGMENRLHFVLDAVFEDDLSRLRQRPSARNIAVVTQFAIHLGRSGKDKRSIKLRRKIAGWDPNYLAALLASPPL
ncbi:MAG: transposase [Methylocella sp.]